MGWELLAQTPSPQQTCPLKSLRSWGDDCCWLLTVLLSLCSATSDPSCQGSLRPGRLQKLKDRRGLSRALGVGLDAHCCYAPARPAIGLELQAQQSQTQMLRVCQRSGCRMSKPPQIPLTELEVVQAGQWWVPVSLGGESPWMSTEDVCARFLVLGPAMLSPCFWVPVCVHMALKGMGSGGPQRWVLPLWDAEGSLLASPGHWTSARGGHCSPWP